MRRLSTVALVAMLPLHQAPQITNGRVEPRAGSSIEREVAAAAGAAEPSWVAWKVPGVSGHGQSCCWHQENDDRWYGCGLEPREAGAAMTRPLPPSGPVPLEAGTTLLVMARVADGTIERVRAFSDDCPLDAGGRTVRLVEGVSPEASVRWLSDQIAATLAGGGRSTLARGALSAIANTAGPAAAAALVSIAKTDTKPATRGEALVWLAQRAGTAAAADITAAIQNDPDTTVQQRAAQALSLLPKDEGVPLLIQVARTHGNAKVRERAMFWLGRSKDPRATKFFEDILMK